MRQSFRCLLFAIAIGAAVPVQAAQADTQPQVEELIRLHNLRTSVSIGNLYLKQASLVSVRALLARIGREESLGADWQPANPYWRQAEEALLERAMLRVESDFASLEWLRPLWVELGRQEFSPEELSRLVAHFRSDVGRKQAQIIDHTVSTHVMMALSFAGKLNNMPGVEEELALMQALWNNEDREMRFSIQDAANADGQAFALSPLGKKYFVTAILKLTGIVNRRLDEMATQLQADVARHEAAARPYVEGFKSARR